MTTHRSRGPGALAGRALGNTVLALGTLAALTLLPGTAAAQSPAFVPQGAYLYSGPGTAYPLVGTLRPGSTVSTFGCMNGWGWCDVAIGPLRGWLPGPALQLSYGGRWGGLTQYGPMMGLPIIPFVFDSYWRSNYSRQPWFSDRDRWGGGGRNQQMGGGMGGQGRGPNNGGGRGPGSMGGPGGSGGHGQQMGGGGMGGQGGRPGNGPGR